MSLALIVLIAGTLVAAAIDVRSRKIPNALTAPMAFAGIALHARDGMPALLLVLAAIGIAFALGALAFSAGWFGGGDVKLVAAACGLVSFPGCVGLVLFILIAGAILGLAQAARRGRLLTFLQSAATLSRGGNAVAAPAILPYGVAIAGGSTAYAFSTLFPFVRLPL